MMRSKNHAPFRCVAFFLGSGKFHYRTLNSLRQVWLLSILTLFLSGNANAVVPIQFGSADYAGSEGSVITIDVQKPSPDALDATVDFSISNGTAIEGTDFTVSTKSPLSWLRNDTTAQTISITLLDDSIVELDESFQITLSNAQSNPSANDQASLGTIAVTTVLIGDTDPGPGARVSAVSGDGQSGTVASTLQNLELLVMDGASPVENVPVTWSVSPAAAATLQPVSTTTTADGRSSVAVSLNQDGIGLVTVSAVAQAVGRVDFTIDTGLGNVPPAVINVGKVAGDAQLVAPGGTLDPFVIELLDQNGEPIAGNDVNWSVDPLAAGSLLATTATGSDGRASNTLILDANASGVVTVTATAVGGAQVAFTVSTGGFAGLPGLTPNQRDTAAAFESTCAALNSGSQGLEALAAACSAVGADLVTAIQQITPDQLASQGNTSVELQDNQFVNITSRMAQLRAGATGSSVSGLSLNFQGQPLLTQGLAYLMSNASGGSGGSAGAEESDSLSRLGMFLNGSGSFGDRDTTTDELGFDFNTKGITAGADYRVTDALIFGGALGYASNDLDFNNSQGDQKIKGYTISAFGTWYQSENIYIDGIMSYGKNDFDLQRRIRFGTTDVTANSSTDSAEFAVSIGGGYNFSRNAFTFGPFARVNYVKAEIDAYQEDPAGGLELGYDDQETTSLTSVLGGQASYAISSRHGVFLPQVRFEWAHEYDHDSRNITARFLNDPNTGQFEVGTENPDRDYFNLGAGVTAVLAGGRSAFLYYEAVLGRDNLTEHSIAGGLRIEF